MQIDARTPQVADAGTSAPRRAGAAPIAPQRTPPTPPAAAPRQGAAGPGGAAAAEVSISGQGQARLEATVKAARESQQDDDSRIRDADLAYESAQLAKRQIEQQKGVAVLAQANGLNQGALRLLG
ncbi:MAG: flagellin [Candidatus Sericytochromatia bacterium]|nr:flagellin [Candidatus Sericytochromatia bacterium]